MVAIVVLLYLSTFFSSSRATLAAMGRVHVHALTSGNSGHTTQMLHMAKGPKGVLSTVLVKGGVIGLSTSSVSASLTVRLFKGANTKVTANVLAFLVLVFNRMAPGAVTAVGISSVSLATTTPVKFLVGVLAPIVFVVGGLSLKLVFLLRIGVGSTRGGVARRRLHAVISMDRRGNIVRRRRQSVVRGLFSFNSTRTGRVVIPQVSVAFIRTSTACRRMLSVFHRSVFAHLPICRSSASGMVKVVGVGSFLLRGSAPRFSMQGLLQRPCFACRRGGATSLFLRVHGSSVSLTVILSRCKMATKLVALRSLLRRVMKRVHSRCSTSRRSSVAQVDSHRFCMLNSTGLGSIDRTLSLRFASSSCSAVKKCYLNLLSRLPRGGRVVLASGGVLLHVSQVRGGEVRQVCVQLPRPLRRADSRRGSRRWSMGSRNYFNDPRFLYRRLSGPRAGEVLHSPFQVSNGASPFF